MTIDTPPGSTGIAVIVCACIAVSWIITFVTGSWGQWPFVLAGIVVGLWAVAAINR